MIVVYTKTPNPLNSSHRHWSSAAAERKKIRQATAQALLLFPRKAPTLPVVVTLTRVGRKLDAHDGLRAALKPVVDEVAAWLGADDADPRIQWVYRQRTWAESRLSGASRPAVLLQIETAWEHAERTGWVKVAPGEEEL